MVEETITGSRVRGIILGVPSLIAAVASLGLLQGDLAGAPAWLGWVGFVIFGAICTPVFGGMALRPHRLVLKPEGLTEVTTFGQTNDLKWAEIEDFFLWSKQVGYRLHHPERGGGAVRTLGGDWTGGSDKVVERLNRYREAALSGS